MANLSERKMTEANLALSAIAGIVTKERYYVVGQGRAGLEWSDIPRRALKFHDKNEALAWLRDLRWGNDGDPEQIKGHSGVGLLLVRL